MVCPKFKEKKISLAIKEYLLANGGEGYPYEFYLCYNEQHGASYPYVSSVFRALAQLGLVTVVREEANGRGFPRKIYKIVWGKVNDPRWRKLTKYVKLVQ